MFRISSWSPSKTRIDIVPIMTIQQQRQLLMSNWTTAQAVCNFRRSNAVRVKGRNFDLLPKSLQQSILALRPVHQAPQPQIGHIPMPSLFEQIRQGVQLRSVQIRAERQHRKPDEIVRADFESMSVALARALERRNQVMQQTDDEDSDLSSIDSRM